MSEDRIEALFLERARLRSLGAPSQMYRATSTGFNPITFEPGPESNPILGGNEMQGFPQPTADDAMQERAPSNEVGGRLSDLATNALQLLGDDFGAAYQQFRIREVEDRIEDGSLKPVDYQMAVIENPTVPLGDYYDAASGTFSGVPSDDYILHQGQLYPRVITDAQTGEEIDLSEDNQLINFGRALMGGMMEQLEGVGVAARATQQLLRGGAPDPTVMNMGLGGATVPVDRAADVSDIGFYSAVNRAVEALPMQKGTASQMRAMIAKSEGVKPEEMAWIGLDDFLKGKKSVTKAEVQEYVQANQVQIEEVTKRGDLPQRTGDEWQELIDNAEAQGDYDAADALTQQWEAAEGLGGPDSPKFASYTLPGGKNYREVLLTLPETRAYDGKRYLELQRKDFDGKLNDPDEVAELYRLADAAKEARKNKFTGGHFEEPNVLAHMRLNDRTGPNGERILFIEEIQSDWHQKGRKAGYLTKNDEEVKSLIAEKDVIVNRARINPADGSMTILPEDLDRYNELVSQIEPRLPASTTGVPDAPMKKTWHEMSFRRVARMAAEEGYDAIAWTPGKMQAERYDLSEQIDELRYRQNDDGTFDIVPVRNGNTIQAEEFEGVSKDRLSDVVGKEVAEKMVKGEGESDPGTNAQTLRGLDLEVGGEGMEGFYDQMLKTYAAKWGKKFGAKVGVTEIDAPDPEAPTVGAEVWTLPVTKKMRDSLMKKGAPLFTAGGAVAMSQVEREQNDN